MITTVRNFTPINAVTASVTATNAIKYKIERAQAVVFEFKRANHGSGQSDFKVDVSTDGTNWVQYNKLIKMQTNTNGETLVRSGTVNFSGNGTEIYTMSPEDAFAYVRVYVTETADGTHTARITIFQ